MKLILLMQKMKRLTLFGSIVLLLISGFNVNANPSDPLQNGGFETGSISPWIVLSGDAAITSDSTYVKYGSYAVLFGEVTTSSTTAGTIAQVISYPVEEFEKITLWVYADEETSWELVLIIEFHDTYSNGKTYSLSSGWQKIYYYKSDISYWNLDKTIVEIQISKSIQTSRYNYMAVDDVRVYWSSGGGCSPPYC